MTDIVGGINVAVDPRGRKCRRHAAPEPCRPPPRHSLRCPEGADLYLIILITGMDRTNRDLSGKSIEAWEPIHELGTEAPRLTAE
jgi:hypothetical protein